MRRISSKFSQAPLLASASVFALALLLGNGPVAAQAPPLPPERALAEVQDLGKRIDPEPIRRAAVAQNGRIKPLDTLARETNLFIVGSYSRFGLSPAQLYLALSASPAAPWAQVLEVRDTALRQKLGYMRDKRFFSVAELENSPLPALVEPLFKKQEAQGRLTEEEKSVIEAYRQASVLAQVVTGDHFAHSIDFSFLGASHGQAGGSPIAQSAKAYLAALAKSPEQSQAAAVALEQQSRGQAAPDLFRHYLGTLDVEVFYNDARLFLWASIIALLAGIAFTLDIARSKLTKKAGFAIYALALLPLVAGIALRVYITEFAPVTNMFGTMLWVALGVTVFSLLLFALYQNWMVSGVALIATSLILALTEQIPLVLSPDLDPLVAVLRSNFWLSTHVTTITISYAAFTVAMALGNVGLARAWFGSRDSELFYAQYAHYVYRMIQLGCFLLSVGIVLGGIWADYSWGRFWGWDPKETWALIADMGFLALLHARYIGWVNKFTLLALAPVAYLLVVMAWYGVNFILATGLHSYGFSSGGATMVVVFVSAQVLFIAASLLKYRSRQLARS
jgi:ABC-type transport system involved in cytochrome c biogenesis permease subunit